MSLSVGLTRRPGDAVLVDLAGLSGGVEEAGVGGVPGGK